MRGIVKRWVKSRGYGFIEPEEGGETILVHHRDLDLMSELREGQKVEFELDTAPPRPRAIKVRQID